jgi:hypothetical protein
MILAPHPELAKLYLDLRPGDSNADRLLLCIVRHCFVPPASSRLRRAKRTQVSIRILSFLLS